jgi:hypothetical protein
MFIKEVHRLRSFTICFWMYFLCRAPVLPVLFTAIFRLFDFILTLALQSPANPFHGERGLRLSA